MLIKQSSSFKSTTAYPRHTIRYCYACKACAMPESIIAYTRHTVRYRYACKACATVESSIAYTRHTVRYRYTCKACATVESMLAYTRHTLAVNIRRNIDLFCATTIIRNLYRTVTEHTILKISITLRPCRCRHALPYKRQNIPQRRTQNGKCHNRRNKSCRKSFKFHNTLSSSYCNSKYNAYNYSF